MSRYNTYARQLDAAFRSARDEYAAAYDNLVQARRADTDAKAWRPNDTAEDKQLRTATAALNLSKAEAEFKIADGRIWSEFDMKCKELRKELEKDVQKNSLANPDAIDANALELLKSGALTVEDYYSFAERYESNATMLRVISKYALDASENADDAQSAAALRILSDNCKTGMGTVLRAWSELEGVASYCSGRGGSSRTAIDPTHIISMGKWWEELAGQAIENF
jgi:hypothetical protein